MKPNEIDEILLAGSIADIGAAIRRSAISIEDLVGFFLSRIDRLNQNGPKLNAVRCVSDRALDDARLADAELAKGQDRGPLHGIPVLLKDNIAVSGGLPLSGGVAALTDFRPSRDATIVRRLREAGAIILGKTNLTEFADYVSDVMPSEFSAVGGVVRNPHGARYDRGQGSSVGSAAAVAAGLAPLAFGSETQNSIQTPAAHSSVVGFKPSVGAVSRAGIIPLVPSQDSPGPLARSVADAKLALLAVWGADSRDTFSLSGGLIDIRAGEVSNLANVRIGVPRRGVCDKPEVEYAQAAFGEALSRLSAAGATIVDPCELPSAEQMLDVRSCVFPSEFRASIDEFFAGNGAPCGIRSLAELISWNDAHPEAIPYGQPLLVAARAAPDLADPRYRADRRRDIALSRTGGIDAAIDMAELDALIVPMTVAARYTGKAGAPVAAIPVGTTGDGRPFAVTLFGKPGTDDVLLTVAAAVERAIGERVIPDLAGG